MRSSLELYDPAVLVFKTAHRKRVQIVGFA